MKTPPKLELVATILVIAGCASSRSLPGGPPPPERVAAPAERGVAPPPTAAACECAELDDRSAVDVEEEALLPLRDRVHIAARRRPVSDADTSDLSVFFGNLHSHTSYSDGSATPRDAYTHARDVAGLDFLGITEHNHRSVSGPEAFRIALHPERYRGPMADGLIPVADEITMNDRFIAIYGQEFSSISRGNHVNVFDVPDVIDDDDVPNGDFAALIQSWLPAHPDTVAGATLLQLNHPWNSNSANSIEYGRDDLGSFGTWRSALDAHAQLIEVINGPSHESGRGLSPKTVNSAEFRRYLNMGFHLAPAANQDNHFETWGTITDARTAVVAPRLTKVHVLEALKNRHAYATLDRNLRIIATVEGELIGSEIATAVPASVDLDVEVTIQDDDEPTADYWIEVYADTIAGASGTSSPNLVATYGPLEATDNAAGAITWELVDLAYEDWDYLYLKILQGPETAPFAQAYLAPVWFTH